MSYFVIYFGEDGMTVTPMNEKSIESLLNDKAEEGMEHPTEGFVDADGVKRFQMDGGDYPLYKHLIIKGEAVMPKAVNTVTSFKL